MNTLREILEQLRENEGFVNVLNTAQTEMNCGEPEMRMTVITSCLVYFIGVYVCEHFEDFAGILPEDVLGMMNEAESMVKELEKDMEDD